ncbi:hypothetical protein [Pseudomonas phage PIP]|nr:hypothetical protein [Pseudomonas phage PIP]
MAPLYHVRTQASALFWRRTATGRTTDAPAPERPLTTRASSMYQEAPVAGGRGAGKDTERDP